VPKEEPPGQALLVLAQELHWPLPSSKPGLQDVTGVVHEDRLGRATTCGDVHEAEGEAPPMQYLPDGHELQRLLASSKPG
jgi:hypothetical protein